MSEIDNPAMRTVMGPEWVKEQRERQMRMDRLYTGLAAKAEELEKELDG